MTQQPLKTVQKGHRTVKDPQVPPMAKYLDLYLGDADNFAAGAINPLNGGGHFAR
jgi:hypothetical protein